jgi:citrate lyase subunit beta / citryl-CoA lyase
MLQRAAASRADCVICDLEDAVVPDAKVEARERVVAALNSLDWGKKTRSVRINDVATEWCFADIITVVEKSGVNIDTLVLPKTCSAADVAFLDRLLTQLEQKLKAVRRIGIEVLIEDVRALQNVKEIADSSERLEALIFGMGDYSASQGIDTREIGSAGPYPGDIFHYARFQITMAARAAGLDAIDGPYANFKNEGGLRLEAIRARSLGMVGKWAIHPLQIEPGLEIFTPAAADIAYARKVELAYREGQSHGLGAIQVDGVMVDVAVMRMVRNLLTMAELIGI